MRNAVNLNGIAGLHRQAENDHSSDPKTATKGRRQAGQAKKMDWFVKNAGYGGVVRYPVPVEERRELYFCSSLSGRYVEVKLVTELNAVDQKQIGFYSGSLEMGNEGERDL